MQEELARTVEEVEAGEVLGRTVPVKEGAVRAAQPVPLVPGQGARQLAVLNQLLVVLGAVYITLFLTRC